MKNVTLFFLICATLCSRGAILNEGANTTNNSKAFSGGGYLLNNIRGGSVTGAVANATSAVVATNAGDGFQIASTNFVKNSTNIVQNWATSTFLAETTWFNFTNGAANTVLSNYALSSSVAATYLSLTTWTAFTNGASATLLSSYALGATVVNATNNLWAATLGLDSSTSNGAVAYANSTTNSLIRTNDSRALYLTNSANIVGASYVTNSSGAYIRLFSNTVFTKDNILDDGAGSIFINTLAFNNSANGIDITHAVNFYDNLSSPGSPGLFLGINPSSKYVWMSPPSTNSVVQTNDFRALYLTNQQSVLGAAALTVSNVTGLGGTITNFSNLYTYNGTNSSSPIVPMGISNGVSVSSSFVTVSSNSSAFFPSGLTFSPTDTSVRTNLAPYGIMISGQFVVIGSLSVSAVVQCNFTNTYFTNFVRAASILSTVPEWFSFSFPVDPGGTWQFTTNNTGTAVSYITNTFAYKTH